MIWNDNINYVTKIGRKDNPTALIVQSGKPGKVVTRVLRMCDVKC